MVDYQPESGDQVHRPLPINIPVANQQRPSQSSTEIIRRLPTTPHSQRQSGNKQHIHSIPQTQNKTRHNKNPKHKPPPRPKSNIQKTPDPPCASYIKPNPMDMNYDGYYDDVLTDDDGRTKEKLDPELIKRIGLIAVGAVVLVVLSIIIMAVL